MRSSSTDEPTRASEGRGTWVRLGVLVLLVALLALGGPAPELTGALLTDTTQVTTVVSTPAEFAEPTDG